MWKQAYEVIAEACQKRRIVSLRTIFQPSCFVQRLGLSLIYQRRGSETEIKLASKMWATSCTIRSFIILNWPRKNPPSSEIWILFLIMVRVLRTPNSELLTIILQLFP